MAMDLNGINNQNEYYTNHYFASYFEENAAETISGWRAAAKESEDVKTPWAMLRSAARQYYPIHDRYQRSKFDTQTLSNICTLADAYMKALGYPEAQPQIIDLEDGSQVPVYLELQKANGAPNLWVLLAASDDKDADILQRHVFDAEGFGEEGQYAVPPTALTETPNEKLADKILFHEAEPPRFLLFIGINQIALIDRNKWNEKRYLSFDLGEIFSRNEETTLQAMAVLLHMDSLCPHEGTALLDELDANSQKHAQGVSQDLKFALRECIEMLGNEALYDMANRQGRNLTENPVDAGDLTLECLRYMYRMLFVLFIESRPELGYAPMKAQAYQSGYSLESLREIAESIREDVENVGEGYYLHETLSKIYTLIYEGYPGDEAQFKKCMAEESLHDLFYIAPLKAHIFDPEFTKMLDGAKIRNKIMLQIVDKMSMTRESGKKNARRGRISYANLGINQMGSVYEALLSYRGFIAEEDLYEVKRKGEKINDLDVGYFVKEQELSQYDEDERVRYESGENKGKLRMYPKGTFVYRLAGREREKSASYYTPECLTKCLVKYALKELLKDKTADDILNLTVCEPAMGSAAFLNEAINQLAEAYLDLKQKELGESIPHDQRTKELQKVKMYIADRNVYGIDLNPVAVELAEVSLWLNTIYGGSFVPWFGNQLVNGNSLIGARKQCYRIENLEATSKGLRWFENAPDRVPLGSKRMPRKQVYHFLLGDPGMCDYTDKVIKSLEPDNLKKMKNWNKAFNAPYSEDDIATLLRLSAKIDQLWEEQVAMRHKLTDLTQDSLSVYGYQDTAVDSHTTIREKDQILTEIYKTEDAKNAGPYARLKFAMDYWCALWFWPIDKANLLPTRSEFLFDMSLILEGTIQSIVVDANSRMGQMSLFPVTEMQQLAIDVAGTYGDGSVVDIPALREKNERLNLAAEIAEQNKFMHWELEFADLFADRDGFDLVVGNPPWVKIEWNEQNLLSDTQPLFAVKSLDAAQTALKRNEELKKEYIYKAYFSEYQAIAGEQAFMNANQNYMELKGQQTNLYKGFLPQAWRFGSNSGISAFIHPEGVYDEPRGGQLRTKIYPLLRKHFQFRNELKLFSEVHHSRVYSLNIYGNQKSSSFDSISNLFTPSTVDDSYALDVSAKGIKDENGQWNTDGSNERILKIGKNELTVFSKIFDCTGAVEESPLLALHTKALFSVIRKIANQKNTIGSESGLYVSEMWNETTAQKDKTIKKDVRFAEKATDLIMLGAQIGLANLLLKTPRKTCSKNSDYDTVDLLSINPAYFPRSNYAIGCPIEEYIKKIPILPDKSRYDESYRIFSRKMIDPEGSRSLIAALAPPGVAHTHGITGIYIPDREELLTTLGALSSLPVDYFLKATAKANFQLSTLKNIPYIKKDSRYAGALIIRMLKLNALTDAYSEIWNEIAPEYLCCSTPSKSDSRLYEFVQNTEEWTPACAVRTDYGRRQCLVEVDVLMAIAIGMSLKELKEIYSMQFHILKSQESKTYYDRNGRIVFTNNRSLTGVGFTRPEFEAANAVVPAQRGTAPWNGIMKDAPEGYVFERTITDDTMPGGPVERTIQYFAPFDRCDREQDYETAWKFFEEKYGDQ